MKELVLTPPPLRGPPTLERVGFSSISPLNFIKPYRRVESTFFIKTKTDNSTFPSCFLLNSLRASTGRPYALSTSYFIKENIMLYTIENDYIKLSVKDFGCEITSIFGKKNEREYLWQGNEAIWSGQSPILFPVIGRLLDDCYRFSGKQYAMPKHGFARRMLWEFKEQGENSLSFILKENEETLKLYPFSFTLTVTYTLKENTLSVAHEIQNNGEGMMYFSIGAHPAFNCKIGDSLYFDTDEALCCEKIDLERSLVLDERSMLLNGEREIVVTEDIFKEDALILSGMKSEYITLKAKDSSYSVRFFFGKAPYLGLWAKPGAPYICIEPWCGINDTPERKADISEKRGINALLGGEKFRFAWTAEIN